MQVGKHSSDRGQNGIFSNKIIQSENDKKTLFRTAKCILNISEESSLRTTYDAESLPLRFSNFSMDKIVKIRSAIASDLDISAINLAKEELFLGLQNSQQLKTFQPISELEIQGHHQPHATLTLFLPSWTICNLLTDSFALLKQPYFV